MTRKISTVDRALLIGAVACSAVACSSDADPAAAPSGKIEIFSWWTADGEIDALRALLAVQEEKFPNTEVKNLTEDLADQARVRLEERLAEGAPPSTFQANIGADLFKWVLFNGSDDSESKVEPLNAMAEQQGWLDIFPAPVLDALSYEGTLYGVPANIHRLNSLFFSTQIFEEQGLTPPTTLDELLTVSESLQDAGFTPLCIGSEHWWTLSTLVFENIFPAVAGGDYYQRFWTGQESADSAEVAATLDYLARLWPYFNADANNLSWTGGIDHMFDEESACAMTVMGDWTKGYLETKGWTAGTDFGQLPFPGSEGTFVFTADSFPLPKGAQNRVAAESLLETIGSVEGQLAFNRIKGSIPVRTDVEPSEFDQVARQTMRDFAADNLVKAMSGLLPQASFEDLGPSIKDMLTSGDETAVINALSNDYATLR